MSWSSLSKRFLSLLLCLVMLTSMLPLGALAADQETVPPTTVVETVPETTAGETVPATTAGETIPATTTGETVPETTVGETVPETTVGETVPETTVGETVPETTVGETVSRRSNDGTALIDEDISSYVTSRANSSMLTAAIFFSDVHEKSADMSAQGHEDMENVLTTIGKNGVSYETIGMVGDTFTDTAGTMAAMTSAAQTALGQSTPCYYAYGSHDSKSDISASSGLVYTGNYYYIYHISDANMRSEAGATSSNASAAIEAFETVAKSMDKTKVLFIMTHAPLHDRRDDNTYANDWYTAISKVADTMDVVVFWAHNHTHEDDVDTAAYYVAKDGTEKMTIYNGSSIIPNFTYMNAGYINANDQSPARKGYATTVEIYADKMVFQDYTSSGATASDDSNSHNVPVVREFAATKTLSSIAVTTQPTKTVYNVGETLDTTGMVVTATYSDGSTETVTGYTLSDVDMTTAGEKTVTVTYEGKETTFTITVNKVLSSIAVTTQPTKTVYNVGETLDTTGMVVTATYSDGSTEAVTGYTLSDVDMTTAGEKTVTVTYEGKEATFTVTVSAVPVSPTVSCWDDSNQVQVEATALGLTGITATNVTPDPGENAKFDATFTAYGCIALDIALEGHTDGNSIDYSISVVPGLDITNLELYYVDADGNLMPVEFKLVTDELNNVYVEFTTTYVGTFVYGSAAVPEGYTLTKLELANIPTDVLVGTSLDMTGDAEITATYTKEGAEDFVRKLTIYDYDYTNFSGYDVNVVGPQNVIFTFEGVEATYAIIVWNDEFTTNNVTVQVGSGDVGVTALNVGESTNANVETAIQYVINGNNYVAYEIDLTFEEGYAETETEKTVTLPIPEGVNNPVVYYVPQSGAAEPANVTEVTATTVTFTTNHFSTYVIGESQITVPENETASSSSTTSTTETKEVYVLVNSISAEGDYLIVDTNAATTSANLLTAASSGVGNTSGVTVKTGTTASGTTITYIENPDNATIWSATSSGSGYKLQNTSSTNRYLRMRTNGENKGLTTTSKDEDASTFISGTHTLYRSSSGSQYYVSYDDGWTYATGSQTVYIYQKQNVSFKTTTTVSGTYSIRGEDISMVVTEGSTATLSSTLVFDITDGEDILTENPTGVTYEIVTVDASGNTVDGDPNNIIEKIENGVVTFTGNYGVALVKVSCVTEGGTVTDYITVEAKAPYYSIELHKADLTEVADDAEFDATVTYYVYNATTGNYQPVSITAFEEGVTYYTTPVVPGDEITAPVALKGVEAGDTYSVWAIVKEYTAANPEGKDLGALGDALTWTVSDASIATIDIRTGVITFTGTNYGTFQVTVSYKGSDGIVIADTITISATESLYVVPGDGTDDFPEYPKEGAVRFDKTASAVGNFSETGIAKVELSMTGVPYSTGNAIDVLLMLDMSTSMDESVGTDDDGNTVDRKDVTVAAANNFLETIVKNNDGTFNSNKVAIGYFNGSTVAYVTGTDSNPYISISDATTLTTVQSNVTAIASKNLTSSGTYYGTALANAYSKITTQDAASDNTQAFVFMSDGGPTQYTYVNGDSYSTASQDSSSTIVGWFTTSNNGTSDDETDDTATPTNSFKTEYYTYKMKAAGYPVYTVGLGLANNSKGPSSYTDLTSGAHEAITSYILSSMATNSNYFYNVADDDAVANMGNIFSGIAASIKEAARDVVVEDKIGNNYSINFSLPDGITSTDTDGVEDFYIQVVEYILDSNTHERTGVYTVLENFTFDGETGELKSHTVDGVECTDCAHVTTTGGVITAINGTYFAYKSDSTGEYLTWTAEKLTSTELALQYFAYLDNSAGTDVEDQVAAGTYYTNEYATLTYTNVNNKVVQNEFPIPQMTWNGAQVSYVFYLVNDAGQPVSRTGKVIPFAEAVFVTDVFTESIIWNDMEQSAGLYANYLASEKLPDAYELYDSGASYLLHVYENEKAVNLNNHFAVGSAYDGVWNTTAKTYYTESPWDNDSTADELAYTTFVFNNKSDTTKYNVKGTYVADDGDTTKNETGLSYFCKSAIIEGATYTSTVENGVTVYTVSDVGNGYQEVEGETQATVSEIRAAGGSTTGGTQIGDYIYYVDETGNVYTIVTKTNGQEVEAGFDFANTTVAFAVVWKPELEEDTVVVDFGLDVVVDVIKNDNMAAGVVGVRTDAPSGITQNSGTYTAAKATSVDVTIGELTIGTATVENLNSIRFSLDKTNGMQFSAPADFYYEADVNYYVGTELKTTSMYSKVTVIPATTVYYEDEFLTLKSYTKGDSGWAEDEDTQWETDETTVGATQAQDRPGASKISAALDADNNYGYDAAYETMTTHSLGSAAKITVNATTYGEAIFTFYGTGFDLISLTSNTTGTITVKVSDAAGNTVKNTVVDTYYGMEEDGTLSINNPDTIYQVPVIKVAGLTYGQYTVKITAAYNNFFNHTATSGAYDLYMDAVRIYDPTGVASGATTDEIVSDAYIADGEAYPVYQELRNNIIAASNYTVTENSNGSISVTGTGSDAALAGGIFIDCNNGTTSIADYVSYGPNNELYLANGQAIAFEVNMSQIVADVQLGIKVANGSTVTYEINGVSYTTNSTSDLYYSVLEQAKKGVVTIKNVSGGILSLTNIKVTHTSAPTSGVSLLAEMDGENVGTALMMLRRAPVVEDEVPETTESEETAPETTEPEETTPETTEPEETAPETTESEETAPETTEPEETTPETTESEETTPETTEPEETTPETTVPEETEPEVTEPETVVQKITNTVKNFFKKLFGWLFR